MMLVDDIASTVPWWTSLGAVIALFALTAWIEKNKDNPVQEWLMRCHFGTHPDKHKTEAEEASELQKAFA